MINHKIILLLFLFFIGTFLQATAQDDCIVKLNESVKLYDLGKIEKIPEMLSPCIESGFNKENRISALRLLTLVYLFEDNQNKAELTMLRILKIDPEFKINPAIDPVEFVRLYNSYNTSPVYSVGAFGGLNISKPNLIETYSFNSFNEANSTYSSNGLGYVVGLKANYHINTRFDLSLEPSFTSNSYSNIENVSTNEVTTVNENIIYIDFPVYGNYYFYKYNKYHFYGELGMAYGMLLSSKFNGIKESTSKDIADYEGPAVNTTEIRTNYLLSTSVGIGTTLKLNRSNIQLCLRYKFGLNNIVNDQKRFSNYENLSSIYKHQDDDYTNNVISLTVSYNFEFYRHHKKPANKTNYDVIK